MADSVTFQLTGWDELVSSLEGPVAEKLADPQEAELAAANVIARLIRNRAPRATGHLAGSFMSRAGDTGGLAYTEVVYGGVLNYGWAAHNIAPRRYVEAAALSSADEVQKAFEEYVAQVMDEMRGE